MQYLQGLPADVGAIPLLLCATKEDLPGILRHAFVSLITHALCLDCDMLTMWLHTMM